MNIKAECTLQGIYKITIKDNFSSELLEDINYSSLSFNPDSLSVD